MPDTVPDLIAAIWPARLTKPLPEWHVYQSTTNDCGPYSATIVANALYNAAILDAPTVAHDLEESDSFGHKILPSRIKGSATFPWGVQRALETANLKSRWRIGVSLDRLRQNLTQDLATIIIIGDPWEWNSAGEYVGWSHYKIVYAWSPDVGWAFVDPATPHNLVYSYQTEAEFDEQWTWMGRQAIEAWKDNGI